MGFFFYFCGLYSNIEARMVESVDTPDLKSCGQ